MKNRFTITLIPEILDPVKALLDGRDHLTRELPRESCPPSMEDCIRHQRATCTGKFAPIEGGEGQTIGYRCTRLAEPPPDGYRSWEDA